MGKLNRAFNDILKVFAASSKGKTVFIENNMINFCFKLSLRSSMNAFLSICYKMINKVLE